MKAIVVYESYWGNTGSVAQAIAEGLGAGTQAMSTAEAKGEALVGVGLIVAGSPIVAFSLPSEKSRNNMVAKPDKKAPSPPDLSHPSLRTWLVALPQAGASVGGAAVRAAAFETGFKLSPGSSAGKILRMLGEKGYRPIAKKRRFLVKASYGPLKEGELDRAKAWGAELAKLECRVEWFEEYAARLDHSVSMPPKEGISYRCPCCGCRTLGERGGFDICPVCFWEDDGQDDEDADVVRGGPNGELSLTQARSNYKEFGACDRRHPASVRAPKPDELA